MKQARPALANHERIYHALHSSGGPMTAYEVLDAVRPHGISAPPTVYRALNRLVEEGLVHRLETLNAYVACREPHAHHGSAIFTICNECGATEELFDVPALKRLHGRAAEKGFTTTDTTVELRGRCAECMPGKAPR